MICRKLFSYRTLLYFLSTGVALISTDWIAVAADASITAATISACAAATSAAGTTAVSACVPATHSVGLEFLIHSHQTHRTCVS